MHATAASMHTQTRECASSLIILFTYCILPINGHKQENKSIKLTCCVLLASKFVDITEISLALFMEADAGWYNTEKMELSSSFSNIDPTMLCHMVNVDTQFPVSFLANSASVQSHATHFRAQSKSFFPSNSRGGGTQLWVGYGCAARSFDHHPITKPEKTQICYLYQNLSFLEGPFLKPNSAFYNVNWDA